MIFNKLATFGGIFGLCVGGSILSLIEMVYFFTFRLYGQTIQQKYSPMETVTSLATGIDADTNSNNEKTTTLQHTIIKSNKNSIVIISQDNMQNMTQYGYYN